MQQLSPGRKFSKKAKANISRALYLLYKDEKNHPRWTGDRVSYRALHQWIQKHRGKPHYCENCKKTNLNHRQYNWANISGKYLRDVTDWKRLCAKCHKLYDKK